MEEDHDFSGEYYEKRLINERLSEIESQIASLRRAFPKSDEDEIDYMGHRKYHEVVMQAEIAKTKFWNELRAEIVKKGLWFAFIVILGLAVNGLMLKLGLLKP